MEIEAIRHKLLSWYDRNKRPLPWRKTSDSYAIWLSEIMLQQTTVETVIPYYEKFLSCFPTLESMAKAPIDELLVLWQGLGLYNRIRQFHRAAQKVVDDLNGVIPKTREELMRLPGLGPYTAGAVASIAFGQPVSAVDGNIIRVLSRLFNFRENTLTARAKKYFEEKTSSLVDPARPGDFNQALMDLGSSLCTPTRPSCPLCPLNDLCEAYRKGKPESLPVRLKKTVYRKEELICLLYLRGGKFWLRRRRPDEIMAGLWEFPLVSVQPQMEKNSPPLKIKRLGRRSQGYFGEGGGSGGVMRMSKRGGLPLKPISHTIMNRRMIIRPLVTTTQKSAGGWAEGRWISPDHLRQLPLTTITRKILRQWDHSPDSKQGVSL